MKCDCLSSQEKSFLHKCIMRHHKENGDINLFKQHRIYQLNHFLDDVNKNTELSEYLIGPVWNIKKDSIRGNYSEILASLFYLDLIDLIYDSKYGVFKRISKDIAESEFNYISTELDEIPNTNTIEREVKEKIEYAWKKYSYLLSNKDAYLNLPLN